MRHADSVDKIVEVYLASVCSAPFRYKGKTFFPKLLIVSPLLLRGHTCPPHCGACCGSFSLDFLYHEPATPEVVDRSIEIDDRRVDLRSDRQADVGERWCRNLEKSSGRCRVHDRRPLACDFELIRFLVYDTKVLLIQKQYGRAWAMARLNGRLGALCQMLPPSSERVRDVVRKLNRLEAWGVHLGIGTRLAPIMSWIEAGDHHRPLRLAP